MPVLRLFAAAREAAGEARLEIDAYTVGEVLDEARRRYGESFTAVLGRSRIWVNGQPAEDAMELREQDVVAILPPVSGGAGAAAAPVAPALPEPPPPVPRPSFAPPPPAAAAPSPPPSPPAPERPFHPAPESDPQPRREEPLTAARVEPVVPAPPEPVLPPSPSVRILPSPPPPSSPSESPSWLSEAETPPPPAAERRGDAPPPPPPSSSSPDDLLDRLAGLPPWPEDSSWYPDDTPPPPEAPEPPPPPRRREPLPEDADDSLWGPGSGPVWSVGEAERRPPVPRDRADWADEPPPPPGPSPRQDASPFAPDEDEPHDSPPEASPGGDRRWDDVVRWGRSEPPEPQGASREDLHGSPVSPPDFDDGPAVRIIGPDPYTHPAPEDGPTSPPVLSVVPPDGGGVAGGPPGGSLLVRERPTPPMADRNGRGAATATVAAAAPAMAPQPAPKPAPKTRPPLAVVPKSTRPHGRLGLLWVAVTVGAIVWTPVAAGIWFAACGGLAAIQTARVWRARNEKPLMVLAGATAAALPLCAIAGLRAMTAAVVVAVVATLLARVVMLTKAPARDVALTLAIGVVIGLAVASVVLLRNIGLHAPLLLLAFAAAYDAGAYLVGTGASSSWEGPAAGIATLIPVTMLSAVILVPPFPEGAPLLLGLLAAVLAPCGPLAGSALLGERDANAPALRRLDSLLVMAPVWSWVAAAFL